MDPGPIPDQLKDLSLTEQQLISSHSYPYVEA